MLTITVYMRLREHTILKFLAIILFTFELLAPPIFSSFLLTESPSSAEGSYLHASSHGSALAFLVGEQMNEEEREGHEDDIILFHVNSFGSYLTSVKRKSNHFPSITQTEKFEAHPLYKLHLAFLI